jgi:hypothetical protein
VDFAKTAAILITGLFTTGVAHRPVAIVPSWQAWVDVILISVDQRARCGRIADDRLDRCRPHIGQHVQNNLAAALDRAEDRRLVVFPTCPGLARPVACGIVPAAPFYHPGRLALVPGHDINFADLDLTCQFGSRCLRRQTVTSMPTHRLHLRGGQIKLRGDRKVREVQSRQVKAQHPHPQRLVMTGQHRIRQIVGPSMTGLAETARPVRLGLVTAMADNRRTVAAGTTHILPPTMLAHRIKAPGIVQNRREVEQLRYGHAHSILSQAGISGCSSDQRPPIVAIPQRSPPRNPTRAK